MQIIQDFVKAHGKTLQNLAERWSDESQYEDIDGYRKVIEPLLPAGMQMQGMTRRPFGFKFRTHGRAFRLAVKLTRSRVTLSVFAE